MIIEFEVDFYTLFKLNIFLKLKNIFLIISLEKKHLNSKSNLLKSLLKKSFGLRSVFYKTWNIWNNWNNFMVNSLTTLTTVEILTSLDWPCPGQTLHKSKCCLEMFQIKNNWTRTDYKNTAQILHGYIA